MIGLGSDKNTRNEMKQNIRRFLVVDLYEGYDHVGSVIIHLFSLSLMHLPVHEPEVYFVYNFHSAVSHLFVT